MLIYYQLMDDLDNDTSEDESARSFCCDDSRNSDSSFIISSVTTPSAGVSLSSLDRIPGVLGLKEWTEVAGVVAIPESDSRNSRVPPEEVDVVGL
jgi:hypothetical protein